MANELRVRIVSNGIGPGGTDVYINGEQIYNCVSATWRVTSVGIATVMLELEGATLEVTPSPEVWPSQTPATDG